ncbi:hypothetical protein MUN77_02775 [Leucobacter allii]|uniref:hypothetical protein n=1 Tax=Leucobacter allii TaxID=2932247 RepID=UPI001FD3F946|nr:hypothetical protein [Leucobacter allii]UOR02273.1 hypothetical protein MUN77_02775 [Leucobacter allii]
MSALLAAVAMAGGVAVRLAEAETDTEFDPTIVSPGAPGFIVTGLLAAAVIVLGFLLVSRLRKSAYRAEVREQIDRELAEQEAAGAADAAASGTDGGAGTEARPGGDAEDGRGRDDEPGAGAGPAKRD